MKLGQGLMKSAATREDSCAPYSLQLVVILRPLVDCFVAASDSIELLLDVTPPPPPILPPISSTPSASHVCLCNFNLAVHSHPVSYESLKSLQLTHQSGLSQVNGLKWFEVAKCESTLNHCGS